MKILKNIALISILTMLNSTLLTAMKRPRSGDDSDERNAKKIKSEPKMLRVVEQRNPANPTPYVTFVLNSGDLIQLELDLALQSKTIKI